MKPNEVIAEVSKKYGEWLEMAGNETPQLLNIILANLLIKEREKNSYYESRLKYAESRGAKT